MKIISKIFLSVLLISAAAVWNGCDKFESFPLNIPITVEFLAQGNNNIIVGSKSFCLDTNSETYQEYKDKIQKLTFIQAAYRTKSLSSANLQGNVRVTLETSNGVVLFSVVINNIQPANYINAPYVLQLTEAQIQAVSAYVSNLNNLCFNGILTVENISGASAPYLLEGYIDMVFEAETEL